MSFLSLSLRISLWTAAACLAASCAPGGRGSLAHVAPPTGWAEQLRSERLDKDRQFRTDPDTPLPADSIAGFRGLEYWAPDPAYRFEGSIAVHERPQRFTIVTTSGKERPCERYGSVTFHLGGTRSTLQVYRLLDSEPEPGGAGFFLPFTDATTGTETYPAGRYVGLEGPEGGPYVLDFNRAYNPLCAYGAPERFRCPVTPSENRLAVRIEAGERGYAKHRG